MGKSRVLKKETFCAPTPQDKVKLFAPPFKEWKLFAPHPSVWLKLLRKNCLQTCCAPIFSMAKTFSAPPPLFIGVKIHMPPLLFCSPHPLLIISDQSLSAVGRCQCTTTPHIIDEINSCYAPFCFISGHDS